jgi:hypothetical protein
MAGRKSTAPVIGQDAMDIPLNVGGFRVLPSELATLAADPDWDEASRVVPLVVEEQRVRIATTVDGHTLLPEYRISVSIVREPVSETERGIVARHEAKMKLTSTERKEQEERNKKALVEAVKAETKRDTQEAFTVAARTVADIQRGVRALQDMGIAHPINAVALGNGQAQN